MNANGSKPVPLSGSAKAAMVSLKRINATTVATDGRRQLSHGVEHHAQPNVEDVAGGRSLPSMGWDDVVAQSGRRALLPPYIAKRLPTFVMGDEARPCNIRRRRRLI